MSDVEETLKRISSHKGVQGIIIWDSTAVPIRSTLDGPITTQVRRWPRPAEDSALGRGGRLLSAVQSTSLYKHPSLRCHHFL
eukprot:scaffold105860_cov33-Tisochrysis_lutea.AAC.2